ncbi:MAG: lipopolysaccharide transport periplasmic protein LptA [Gammaproteobacteria bacterium]|nr:lipopolysaccharide transport periplasmic protein LptA [Gammaproteobacteria bacterium]
MPMRMQWLALLTVCLPSAAALGLSTDSDQPIQIEADRAEANDAQQVSVYRGDVVIVQGTLRISGDVVTIHYDDDRQLSKMVAVGQPARFRQLPDGDTEYQQARARRMEYYADDDLIILLGDAESWQGGDRIKAQRIVYDTRDGRVNADSELPASMQAETDEGVGPQKSRVRVTIVPRDCPDDEKDASGRCP